MPGLWTLLVLCPFSASSTAVHESSFSSRVASSVMRREMAIQHHAGKDIEFLETSRLSPYDDEAEAGEGDASELAHGEYYFAADAAGADTMNLSSVPNSQNFIKEFNISFWVRFDNRSLSADYICKDQNGNPASAPCPQEYMEVAKADNDAIQIDALGSKYAPNDKKIVAYIRTGSGLPAAGNNMQRGIVGAGKMRYKDSDDDGHPDEDADGNPLDEEAPDDEQDGKLYSQQISDDAEWHHVQFIKTHGNVSYGINQTDMKFEAFRDANGELTGKRGRLILIVDDVVVSSECLDNGPGNDPDQGPVFNEGPALRCCRQPRDQTPEELAAGVQPTLISECRSEVEWPTCPPLQDGITVTQHVEVVHPGHHFDIKNHDPSLTALKYGSDAGHGDIALLGQVENFTAAAPANVGDLHSEFYDIDQA